MFFHATTSVYPRLFNFFFFITVQKLHFLQVAQLTYMTKVSQGLAIISDENSKGLITAYLVLSGEAAAKRVNTSISRRGCESPSRAYNERKSVWRVALFLKANQSLRHASGLLFYRTGF